MEGHSPERLYRLTREQSDRILGIGIPGKFELRNEHIEVLEDCIDKEQKIPEELLPVMLVGKAHNSDDRLDSDTEMARENQTMHETQSRQRDVSLSSSASYMSACQVRDSELFDKAPVNAEERSTIEKPSPDWPSPETLGKCAKSPTSSHGLNDKVMSQSKAPSIMEASPTYNSLSPASTDTESEENSSSSSEDSCHDDDTTSDESDPNAERNHCAAAFNWAAFSSILLPLQNRMLVRIMRQAGHQGLISRAPQSQADDPADQRKRSRSNSNRGSKESRGLNKRKKTSGSGNVNNCHGNNDEEDDEKDGEDEQALPANSQSGQETFQLFACPFAKRNPGAYFECLTVTLRDVSKVKKHLRMKHLLPIYCSTCYQLFQGCQAEKKRDEHQRARNCTTQAECPFEGVTSEHQRQLTQRLGSAHGRSEAQKWYIVWDLLFDPKERPDNPYNHDFPQLLIGQYQVTVEQELPSIIQGIALEDVAEQWPPGYPRPSVDEMRRFLYFLFPLFLRELRRLGLSVGETHRRKAPRRAS